MALYMGNCNKGYFPPINGPYFHPTSNWFFGPAFQGTGDLLLASFFHSGVLSVQTIPPLQESYNTPLEHTPGNPLANYERNPFVACW